MSHIFLPIFYPISFEDKIALVCLREENKIVYKKIENLNGWWGLPAGMVVSDLNMRNFVMES
jgi:hypothetical protein